ncbi:MAG: hypothetical protein GY730_00495 [bacterium]|nr:hypothetical protein [bacterium]
MRAYVFLLFAISFFVFVADKHYLYSQKKDKGLFQKVIDEKTKKVKGKKLKEEEIYDLQKEFESLIKRKQFSKAFEVLTKIPKKSYTRQNKDMRPHLLMFNTIEEEVSEGSGAFGKEEDLEEGLRQTVIRLYKEAQLAYIEGRKDVVRDLLIHILFLHRRNVKAKKLLDYGLGLKLGSYKVEDMENKYWKVSDVYFYGGNYEKATEALNILTNFDRENPVIYEKMGSAYYMMARRKKAVEAWKTALFFGSREKTAIEESIKKTQELIKLDQEAVKKRERERKNRKKAEKIKGEVQLMRVTVQKEQAYSYAADLKKNGLNAFVEEMANGKFAVKIVKNSTKSKVTK